MRNDQNGVVPGRRPLHRRGSRHRTGRRGIRRSFAGGLLWRSLREACGAGRLKDQNACQEKLNAHEIPCGSPRMRREQPDETLPNGRSQPKFAPSRLEQSTHIRRKDKCMPPKGAGE